jgi:hypothetical protein
VGALARRVEKLAGRRWRWGGAGEAVGGADNRQQRGKQSRAEAPEEEEEGRGSEGSLCKNRKVQGLTVK